MKTHTVAALVTVLIMGVALDGGVAALTLDDLSVTVAYLREGHRLGIIGRKENHGLLPRSRSSRCSGFFYSLVR